MVKINELKAKQLRSIIKELEKIKGRHTELVSVYVPSGYNLAKVVEQIRSEQSTAQNIKSKSVRKNVLGALEKILQHLKLYKLTPERGLVIFCGNISEKEGVSDIELWAIEPPEPVKNKLYWCGQEFVLDPLREVIREREIYGLIVLDKSEASIGLLKGKKIETLKHLTSIVPGKTKAGGWSQARFARVREGLLHDFLKKVGEVASNSFKNLRDLNGIIIAGPGPIKEQFSAGDFLEYSVKNRVIGVVNTSYTGDYGLRETLERAEDLLSQASVIKEKRVLDRFFTELERDSGLAVYGFHEVMQALKSGNLELLLLSEEFDFVKTELECSECDFKTEKILDRKQLDEQHCPECNAKLSPVKEHDIMEGIIKIAEEMDTRVEVISTGIQKGEQLKELGGIAGILRYKAD